MADYLVAVSSPRPHETIAAAILRTVADMKRAGTFETSSLCWSPAELEHLAMYAIDVKHQLAVVSAGGGTEDTKHD